MKLSFSTIGCPGWDFNEIFATAKDLGMDGIEIRGVGDELYAPRIPEFLPENQKATLARFHTAGLEIPILTSAAVLGKPELAEQGMQEAKDYIDLAQRLSVPYVRVLVTAEPGPQECDLSLCARNYAELCDYAAPKNVSPLLETNGVLAKSDVFAGFMSKLDKPNAGVLWDINHTKRFFDESPAQTVQHLGRWIRHVHVKDSVLEDGRVRYRMMGYGDLQVLDCIRGLKSIGYEGYISLEWVKRMNPDLQEPGVVFAHYENYMKYLFKQL